MVDKHKHKPHMQPLVEPVPQGYRKLDVLHHITSVWAGRRAAPCSVLHTGEHSKSDSTDPSLRAWGRLARSPLCAQGLHCQRSPR